MKRKSIYFFSILILFSFVLGCAKYPTEEINNAIEAVTRAESNDDAVMYAGNTLGRARDAIRRMQIEADAKRYDGAKAAAAEAISLADRAITEGRFAANRAREEAAAIIAALGPEVAETGQAIRAARAAGIPLDYGRIDQDYTTVLSDVDEANAALAGNQYQQALESSRHARAGLSDINSRLTTAVTAVSAKK